MIYMSDNNGVLYTNTISKNIQVITLTKRISIM